MRTVFIDGPVPIQLASQNGHVTNYLLLLRPTPPGQHSRDAATMKTARMRRSSSPQPGVWDSELSPVIGVRVQKCAALDLDVYQRAAPKRLTNDYTVKASWYEACGLYLSCQNYVIDADKKLSQA